MPAIFESAFSPGILQGTLLALFALGDFLGWRRWSYGWRKESMPASLAVIWIPLPYILGHAESLSGPRLPLDGVLLCYAAFAAACMIPGVGGYLFRGAGRLIRKPRLIIFNQIIIRFTLILMRRHGNAHVADDVLEQRRRRHLAQPCLRPQDDTMPQHR